ncbi:hypothetical protein, partial [Mesorhizobium sp. M0052]
SIRVRKQNVFDGSAGGLNFSLGHGGVPSRESGDVNNHQPAMTAPSQRICRTLSTLPWDLLGCAAAAKQTSGPPQLKS